MSVWVFVHDACARWIRLILGGSEITIEREEKAAIIFDCRMDGPGNTMRVKFVGIWLVTLHILGVANDECVQCGRMTDCNAIRSVGSVFGPDDIVVFLLMDVAD